MSTSKHLDAICLAGLLVCILLTGFVLAGRALTNPSADGEAESGAFSRQDLDGAWDTSGATRIVLNGDQVQLEGRGAWWADGVLHIACAGHYVLSGELTDGSIEIDAGSDSAVWLLLDGVLLHCGDSAALLVKQAEKVFLTLAEGSQNVISSGETFREDAVSEGIDGVIYSRDDLTFNGSGSLTVSGGSSHAIVCNDNLVITGGTLDLTATQDGIHANDSVRLTGMDLTVRAGDDGITVSNDDDSAFFLLESGTVSIPSCYEGVEAPLVTISGGILTVSPTDDGINASALNPSASDIRIQGGEITIVNETGRDADGLDSNGSIHISGGITLISVNGTGSNGALDAGTESGGICEISGGTILACGSSMMAEGFDSSSTQGFLMHTASSQTEAGTTVSLAGADGTVLYSEQVPCAFTCLVLSTPDMKVGDTCTLTIGDSTEEITIDNTAASGRFGRFGDGMGQGAGNSGQRPQRTFPQDGGTAPSGEANGSSGSETAPADSKTGTRSWVSSAPETISASLSAPSARLLSSPAQDTETGAQTPSGTPVQPPEGTVPPDSFQGGWPGGQNGSGPFAPDGQTASASSSGPENRPDASIPEPDGTSTPDSSASAPGGESGDESSVPAEGQAPVPPDGPQRPDGISGGQMDPSQFGGRGQRPDGNPIQNGTQVAVGTSSVPPEALLLTGISALVLLAGIILAIRFRP